MSGLSGGSYLDVHRERGRSGAGCAEPGLPAEVSRPDRVVSWRQGPRLQDLFGNAVVNPRPSQLRVVFFEYHLPVGTSHVIAIVIDAGNVRAQEDRLALLRWIRLGRQVRYAAEIFPGEAAVGPAIICLPLTGGWAPGGSGRGRRRRRQHSGPQRACQEHSRPADDAAARTSRPIWFRLNEEHQATTPLLLTLAGAPPFGARRTFDWRSQLYPANYSK
jgi:hypothetical protein